MALQEQGGGLRLLPSVNVPLLRHAIGKGQTKCHVKDDTPVWLKEASQSLGSLEFSSDGSSADLLEPGENGDEPQWLSDAAAAIDLEAVARQRPAALEKHGAASTSWKTAKQKKAERRVARRGH